MLKNFTNKDLMTNIMSLAAILFFVFGAVSCTEEHFIEGEKPTIEQPEVPVAGDTIASFSDFRLNEGGWSYSNGLAAADHYFDGYVEYKVKDQVVKSDLIDHENAPMRIEWTPIEETTAASAEKMYLGQSASEAKFIENHTNQKVSFKKYERENKLSFVGMEVVLKGSWYEASLGNNSNIVACRYDSTTIATQVMDTVKVNGSKIEIDLDGKKYNRVVVTAKAENHFTDLPANTTHSEEMDIQYSVLVPVIFVPGEKFYEGSIAGNGSYTKASEESYRSSLELTHIFTQDGKQIKEQETVSGIATVKTWVEGDNNPKIWSSSNIGNPSVSVNETVSDLYQKDGYIYAKKYTTVWSYTWTDANTGESFRKEIHSEVERLYYRREAGKEVAMPFGETSSSYAGFNAGAAVIKTQNGKEYEAYSGQISFNGNHKSTTGNVNDAISGLKASQEIWVEVVKEEDKFIGFDKEIIKGDNNNDSKIIIVEHWSISGDKEIVFTQSANYTFSVSEQQRVFGESLSFISGLSKSTNATEFNEVKEGQFARTITSTYTAKFNLCEVEAIAKATEAYVEYRGEKIYFKFVEASVEYKGTSNPTVTEVEAADKKYTRKAYEVTFAHNVLGNKVASVLVDEEIIDEPSQDEPTTDEPTTDEPTTDEPTTDEPTTDEPTPEDPVEEIPAITVPSEWGNIDIAKTKAYGTISVAWELQSNGTFMPIYSGTVITSKGIVSFRNGYEQFTPMNTASISDKVGNAWDGSRLYPSYIEVDRSGANISWSYISVVDYSLLTDVNSSKMTVVGGIDIEKPFVAEGGNASVYTFSENGNTVRVVVTFNGVIFNEVFAK